MTEVYLILVVVLFALAISDLIVGVSNDAVNFLNSAIGAKSAPKWIIFTVASLGVLAGSTFSSGMMEVARSGIFNPEMFVFSDIMIIFLAVMITDVILLDSFNALGMPTSTTVSIVFELLGAAVAVSLVKMNISGESASMLGSYINSDKALVIISGILLSVVIAFTVGALVQWITRLLFSFRYEKRLKYFGSLYGGLAIAVMTYFMIIKGAKGASFITVEMQTAMTNNLFLIIAASFAVWTIILQLLKWVFNINILKVIVLVGTFALAMAFAGNDLVNFIGVPLAAFESYKNWVASGVAPDMLGMEMLAGRVQTPTIMLLIAGLIMVVTLITSKKARNVVQTSIDLSRQSEGSERFGSSSLSRMIVRSSVKFSENMRSFLPEKVWHGMSRQFQIIPENESIAIADRPAFDELRAASNLMVASILISIATSYKLPLSTTYVTFMVAMGTSLADKAWGRDSAVYRISGVFAVIGGWFLTALIAFSAAFVVARIMVWGGFYASFALVAFALFVIVRTQIRFNKKNKKPVEEEEEDLVDANYNTEMVLNKCNQNTVKAIITTSKAYFLCFEGFFNDDRQQVKNAVRETDEFNKKAKKLKDSIYKNIQKLQQDSVGTGHLYVQIVDYLREMAHSLNFIVKPVFTHYENNHKPFTEDQVAQFNEFGTELNEFFNYTLHLLKEKKFDQLDELINKRSILFAQLKELEKAQIKRIKTKSVTTRNSILYFKIISETKNLLLHLINVIKAERDFIAETKDIAQKEVKK